MFKKGRVCLKIAGRDANRVCVVEKPGTRVVVYGPHVRKRAVNPAHLEPLPEKLDLNKLKAEEVLKNLEDIELKIRSIKQDRLSQVRTKAKARAAKQI